MKRLIYKLLVGAIAFTIGLGLTSIWKSSHNKLEFVSQSSVSSVQIQDLEPAVTVCGITAHPQFYLGKRIRLRSRFIKFNWQTLAGELSDCSGSNATVTIKSCEKESLNLFSLPESNDPSEVKDLDVEIVGYLEPKDDGSKTYHHYHMSDAKIIRVFSAKVGHLQGLN